MKAIKTFLLVLSMLLVFIYIIFSFSMGSLLPFNWDINFRTAWVIISIFSFIPSAIASENINDKDY